jgi:hypothetical protein
MRYWKISNRFKSNKTFRREAPRGENERERESDRLDLRLGDFIRVKESIS